MAKNAMGQSGPLMFIVTCFATRCLYHLRVNAA